MSCGTILDIKKQEGGIDNRGFYTATIHVKKTYKGKTTEVYNKVLYFGTEVCDVLSKMQNKTLVCTEGSVGSRKNAETGFWESALYGTSVQPLFDSPRTEAADKEEIDDEIVY